MSANVDSDIAEDVMEIVSRGRGTMRRSNRAASWRWKLLLAVIGVVAVLGYFTLFRSRTVVLDYPEVPREETSQHEVDGDDDDDRGVLGTSFCFKTVAGPTLRPVYSPPSNRKPMSWMDKVKPPVYEDLLLKTESPNRNQTLDLSSGWRRIVDHLAQKPRDELVWAQLTSLKKLAPMGQLLKECKVQLPHHEVTSLPAALTWAEDPLRSRTWTWHLHSFSFLPQLMGAHMVTKDDWFLRKAEELIEDWLDDNVCNLPPSEMSWNEQTPAMRLWYWVYLYEYGRCGLLNPWFLRRLLAGIHLHATVLSDTSFYRAGHSSASLDQGFSIMLAAGVLPEFVNSTLWRDLGFERTNNELKGSFTTEGVHPENTPSYHLQALGRLITIGQFLERYTKRPLPWIKEYLDSGLRFLSYIIMPNGFLPPLGDSHSSMEDTGLDVKKHPPLLYSVTQGREGVAPSEVDAFFSASGYAILRDRWHPASSFLETIFLAFKAGFLRQGHKHDDDLSFVLYGHGEHWIIDAGRYAYDYQHPARIFVTSNRAHNAVLIDDLQFIRTASGIGKSRIVDFYTNESFASVTGSHELYPGFAVQRNIQFAKPFHFQITDIVKPNQEENPHQEHNYQVLFHLPADREVLQDEETGYLIVRSKTSRRRRLMIRSDLKNVTIISGQTQPEYQGWASYRMRELVPSTCISFATRSTHLNSVTQLHFEPDAI